MTTTESAAVRERILAEATRLFVARGYNGIAMREIAEAAGVSKAGLYYHFADKEALFLAILQANLDAFEQAVATARAMPTARAQVARLVHELFARPPEQRAIIQIASQELPLLGPAARETFGAAYERKFIGQIAAMLRDGMTRGELRQIDAHTATWALLGMLYPFFHPGRAAGAAAPQETIDRLVALFLDGMAAAPT